MFSLGIIIIQACSLTENEELKILKSTEASADLK